MSRCRRASIAFHSLLLWVGLSAAVWADAAPKRLLVIDTQPNEPYKTISAEMLNTLTDRDFVAGRTLTVIHVSIDHHESQLARIWQYYDGASFDVIYVAGTMAAKAVLPMLTPATKSPLVFASATDPVGLGLIKGFGVPLDRNITGVSFGVSVKDRLKLLRLVLPEARTIGLIYGDMQSSWTYRQWMDELLASDPELREFRVIYRIVKFIPGENGTKRMAMQAASLVRELDPMVDVFLSPSDQLGCNPEFARMVQANATKPLIGILEPDSEGGGAVATLYPSLSMMGRQAGRMVARLLSGEPIVSVPAEYPAVVGIALDWQLVKKFALHIPPDLAAGSGRVSKADTSTFTAR